jgi:multidrug efflux pump subunit AcrA (membrane-fusion protein)
MRQGVSPRFVTLLCWLFVSSLPLLSGCKSETETKNEPAHKKEVPVTLKKIESSNVASTYSLVGSMDSRNSVDIYPRIDGYIVKIPITAGMPIEKGQLLFEVDSNKQEAAVAAKRSSVELAKSDYAKEVGKLGSLQADHDGKQSQVDLNNVEYQRYYWLEKRGVVPLATVDREDRNLRVAKADLNSLNAETEAQKEVIERAKQRIEEAKSELKVEQAELGYRTMTAPFSGVIGNVPVKLGDYVNPQTKLTTLSKNRPLEVNVEVPQEMAKQIRVGTRMEILGNDGVPYGETSVFYVAPTVNLQNQSVLVKGEFSNTKDQLRPDQSVQVKMILKTEATLSVPTEAISFVAGKAFVFVAAQGVDGKAIARQRPIEISSIQNNTATVKSGLHPGEEIVTSGIQLLADKSPIDASGSH